MSAGNIFVSDLFHHRKRQRAVYQHLRIEITDVEVIAHFLSSPISHEEEIGCRAIVTEGTLIFDNIIDDTGDTALGKGAG